MRKIIVRKLQIVLAAVALFSFVGACMDLGQAQAQTANAARITLRVDGMTCASCNLTVKLTLKRLDGVLDAEVTRKPEGRAAVTYEPEKVTVEQMIEAIKQAGYEAYPGGS